MSSPGLFMSANLHRRHFFKYSLASAAAMGGLFISSHQLVKLIAQDASDLQRLARKIMPAIPTDISRQASAVLSQQLTDLQLPDEQALPAALSLLHQDDLSHGRTHELHGQYFSLTQLGVLASLVGRQLA